MTRSWVLPLFVMLATLSRMPAQTNPPDAPAVSDRAVSSAARVQQSLAKDSVAKDTARMFLPITRSGYITGTAISQGEGFDQCEAASTDEMQVWWNLSPYIATGIYLDSSNRTCNPQPFDDNPGWIAEVTNQGWSMMPLWVGKQAPVLTNGTNCSVCRRAGGGPCDDMDPNPTTAAQQGKAEADNAVSTALALLLNHSVIYYDMEQYTSNKKCSPAVSAFIDAWTKELHTNGFLAGVYGEPSNAARDWTSSAIDNPPDALWFHARDEVDSVWDKGQISNTLWANDQRIHQFCTDGTKQYCKKYGDSFGGVTFAIDGDVLDGPVVPGQAPDLVETAVSNPPVSVNAGGTFQATDTTLNQGLAPAGTSVTRFYLSLDTMRGSGDKLLVGIRAEGTLVPGGSSGGTVTVKVPKAITSGTYYLLACADDTQLVKESNEGNNCAASSATVTVSSAIYESFVQGNPGVPGDGIFVTLPSPWPEGDLTVPYSLAGATDGITVSIFSPDLNLMSGTNEFINAYASQSCHVYFESGESGPVYAITVNNSPGIVKNISQWALNADVTAAENFAPGCTFTLSDLTIAGFLIWTSEDQLSTVRVDALAIGMGQNNVP